MRKWLFLVSFLLSNALWAFEIQQFSTEYTDLSQAGERLIGINKDGTRQSLSIISSTLKAADFPQSMETGRPDDILSDGIVMNGQGKIKRAWLGGPTRRYDHGVMLDTIEATRLYADTGQAKAAVLELPRRFVFEDRYPRFADIDNDGEAELIVIRTDTRTGAGIAVYGLAGGELVLEAESETIGKPNRWLNIVGVADFNGDGLKEIAAVITPHIGGKLTLFQQRGKQLIPIAAKDGYSNHQYGSRELGMSAVLDFNADGVMDMAVPDAERKNLILLSANNNQLKPNHTIDNPSGILSGLYLVQIDDDSQLELVFLLNNGTLKVINF